MGGRHTGAENLFGVLPGIFYGWPKNLLHFRGIENSTWRGRSRSITALDAVTGMEGDGPIMGKAKPVGALVLGAFPLAVDATAARLMGFDPGRVPHLAQARRFLPGSRSREIVLRGEPAKRFATIFPALKNSNRCRADPSSDPAQDAENQDPADRDQAQGRAPDKARREIAEDDFVRPGRDDEPLGKTWLRKVPFSAVDPGFPARGEPAGEDGDSA